MYMDEYIEFLSGDGEGDISLSVKTYCLHITWPWFYTCRGLEIYPLFRPLLPGNSFEIRKLCFLETLFPSAIYNTPIL